MQTHGHQTLATSLAPFTFLRIQIVYGIFLPALLMVNVAKTIVSQPVASLLPIPVFAAIQIAVGLVVSGAAMRLLNIDPSTEMGREAKVVGRQSPGIKRPPLRRKVV